MKYKNHGFYIVFLISSILFAQKTCPPNPYLKKSYVTLYDYYYKYEHDRLNDSLIAHAYLIKAKKEKRLLHMGYAYLLLSSYNFKKPKEIIYLDSIMPFIKKIKDRDFLARFYLHKGGYYSNHGEHIKAIDYYMLGYKLAKKNNNQYLLNYATQDLGYIRLRLGEYHEAIGMFKKSTTHLLKTKDSTSYLSNLLCLSEAYRCLKKYNESSDINKKGYDYGIHFKNSKDYNYFVLQEGIIQFYKKNYQASIDSIYKSIEFVKSNKDNSNLAECYFYLGMNMYATQHKAKSITYFTRVDSIFNIRNDLYPEQRQTYEILINYYKTQGNTTKQLYYIERLLKIDKIINKNYKYLSQKINKEYDTPKLLQTKESIIAQLNTSERFSKIKIIILSIITSLFFLLAFYYYKKQKQYQYNFEKLIANKDLPQVLKIAQTVNKPERDTLLDIMPHIVNEIMTKLNDFEISQGFLSNDCTLIKVAKDFQTNPNYLSKIINSKKQMNFTTYINDLRIGYTVKQLQVDKKLRLYAIAGIAQTMGFNTTQAFSKAFYAKTGIKPSYFINELKNKGL